MPIKELAASSPKVGDRVQPINDDRYYFISRINRDRAYYRWSPGDDSPFKPTEDRYIPIELLVKKAFGKHLEIWVEEIPKGPDLSKPNKHDVRPYKGTINWYNQDYSARTVAPSEDKAKSNLVMQFADMFHVAPTSVWTYIKNKPQSFEMEAVKE